MSIPDFFSDFEPSESPDFFEGLEVNQTNYTPKQQVQKETSSKISKVSFEQPQKESDFFSEISTPKEHASKSKGFLDLLKPKPFGKVPVYAEEKTPEEIKALSPQERRQYAEDLRTQRELGQGRGIVKGALSGATFGLSQKIPGLEEKEGDFLFGFSEFLGSALPITKLYGIIGKPLVRLASQSPKMAKGLQSLARITGMGLTGATYEGAKDVVKTGEIPEPKELIKYGAQWAAFDGALQAAGKAISFLPKLKKFSNANNISEKEALTEVVDTLSKEKINPIENPEEAVARAEEFLGTKEPKITERINQGIEKPENEAMPPSKTEAFPNRELALKEQKPRLEEVKIQPKKLKIESIEPSSQKVKTAAKEAETIPVEKRTPEQTQVIALSEQAQPGDPAEKLFAQAPLPDNPSFIERAKKAFLKPKTELSTELNEMKQDYFSKKWGLEWDSRNKWDKMLKENKFSKNELSDMMFYVENPEAFGGKKTEIGTGNPFVSSEDTYLSLENRLTPEAKKAVKEVITPHFKQWVKTINESSYAKKINPRDFLEGVYVPHFYSGDTKKGAKQAAEILSKRFSTNNPFANMRTFLTYNEALQKAGMKPRFDNIADLVNEYDRVMTRVLVNSEYAGKISDLEKEIGSKLIVRSNSPKYAEAKREGWIPFDDPYLRRYVAGMNKEGNPIFATLETPALVHPEAADSFTGIFIKDAQKPNKGGEISLWKPYDALSDYLKSMHVSFSGFHYLTLAEESAKSSGVNLINSFKRGGKLLEDPVFMRDYVQAGGVIGHNPEIIKKSSSNLNTIDQALILSGGPKKVLGQAIKGTREILQKPSKFLFEEFQPRLKVAAFHDMRARYLNKLNKKGIVPDGKQMKQINKELASLSNDMFGGQRFELMQNPTKFKPLDFNDPAVLKNWKRAGGYVDWTASAMREFGKTAKGLAELLPGIPNTPTGAVARDNAYRYARNLFMATQMLNYFNTGLTKGKDGKLTWDSSKAHSTFENEDPSKNALDIQLPDLDIEIAGHKFNIGRDSRGRQLHTHFGKKLLENFHWAKDPIRQLFNKSNPVFQTLFVQAAGGSPTLEGIPFKTEAAFIRGESKPWQGKKGWTTLEPRLKHLFKSSLPYSLQSFDEKGIIPGITQFLATGLGALPITKGMNLTKSEEFYDKYFHDEASHQEDIANLDKLLRQNGYQEKQIKSTKTRIRNRIKEEKER